VKFIEETNDNIYLSNNCRSTSLNIVQMAQIRCIITWPRRTLFTKFTILMHCVLMLFCNACRSQVWPFHRRFDERQPWCLHTNPVELRSVRSVSWQYNQWSNHLPLLSGQPTTVQIRHRSDTRTELPLGRLWNRSTCKRYENVQYQYSDNYHSSTDSCSMLLLALHRGTSCDCIIAFFAGLLSYLVKYKYDDNDV